MCAASAGSWAGRYTRSPRRRWSGCAAPPAARPQLPRPVCGGPPGAGPAAAPRPGVHRREPPPGPALDRPWTLPQKPRELVLHVTPSEKANEATCRRRSGCRPRDTGQSRPETSWTRDACDRCRGTSCTTWSYRVPAPAFPTTPNRNTSHLAVGVTLSGSGIYTDRYARLARWHLACNPVGRFPSPRLRHRGERPRSTWRMSALGWRCRCKE